MVHRQSTHIQQSTASLLKFHPEHLELTIQGLDSCVDLAAKELKMILEDADPKKALKPTSSSSDDDHNTRNLPIINEILSPTDIIQINSSSECKVRNCNSFTGDERLCQEHNINNDITESYLETDSCCISDKIDSHMPFNIPSHSSQHSILNKKSSASSSSAVESDEDNCIVHNVLTDSRNSKQVEQAVKLGYSLNQIETALEKLGPGCTSDNLLSELIKIGNEQSDTLTHLDDLVDEVITLPLNDISLVSRHSENSKRTSPLPPAFKDLDASENLRSIVIDGSNVAMSHGQDRFSCKGIKIAVDWFRKRGHTDITVFVPQWRKEASRPDAPIEDQQILHELERERIMTFTPSRRVQGRRIVSYDDRYVLKHAVDVDGIVVSNDVYRDLVRENEGFRKVVDQRLLMYTFVKDKFMPPDDPLGRLGPSLDDFLRKVPSEPAPKPQDCPYGKKCTYGNKCRFYHPERGFTTQKSITDTLKEQANISFQEIAAKKSDAASEKGKRQKQKLARTKSLIPGEMVSPNSTPDSSLSEAIGKSKPKLGHSKSLISPTKTGDYLTSSRLKLEQAELIENSRKSSLQEKDITLLDDFVSSQKVQKRRKGSSDVRSYSPSPRASPAPSNESILMGNLLNKNFPPSGIWDNLPMTPAHLAVPNSQPQESYSSGHLSVAKKLSDEGSEKNFFMGNKSSPSPPSSLLDDLSPYEEKKLKEQANLCQKNNGGSQTLIIGKEPLEHQTFTFGPVEDNYQSQNAVDFSHSFDDVLSPVSGHIPSMDSGNFSMYGSPQPMMSPQIFPSYPPATKKDNRRYHQGLHRSLSTSHSLKGPEHFLRQTSDVNEHLQLRQQQSTPLFPQHFQNTKEPLLGTLLRQNSSSNPDIYAWPDRCDSGKGLDCETVYHSAPLPRDDKVQSQQPHLISNSHIPGHQLNVHYGAYQFPGPQGTNSSKHNPIRDTSNTLSSYPPTAQPRRAPESNFAYQVPHSLQQHTLPLHSHCQSQVFYPYQLQQPMMYSSDMTSPQLPFYGHPLYQTQSFPPFDSRGTANQGHFSRHSMPQHQHRPEFPQTPSVHKGNPVPLDQEALIPRDDSRYKAFCQLSPVFGEKAVRTFMNRNPDVKDLNQLFNLISAFKVETGM